MVRCMINVLCDGVEDDNEGVYIDIILSTNAVDLIISDVKLIFLLAVPIHAPDMDEYLVQSIF